MARSGRTDCASCPMTARPGGRSTSLDGVSQLVVDPTSSRVAAIGRDTVALVDADSGKVSWRRDEPLDLIPKGGVRFDRRALRLLVATADRDREKKTSRLSVRSYRLT